MDRRHRRRQGLGNLRCLSSSSTKQSLGASSELMWTSYDTNVSMGMSYDTVDYSDPCLVVAMSYDSYQAKHGKAACLASDDRCHTYQPGTLIKAPFGVEMSV